MQIKGVIFDLDETVMNTRFLKPFRDERNWQACYDRFTQCTFYDGIKNILEELHAKDIPIGFVTNSQDTYAKRLLDTHKIKYNSLVGYFGADRRKKPDPHGMLKCSSALGIAPSNIASIGDDANDIIAANKAGMISVAVTWGVSNINELRSANPAITCSTSNELINFLFNNNA